MTPASSHSYRAYELTVSVPFRCLDLPLADPDTAVDVVVTEGAVEPRLAAPRASDGLCEENPGRFLWRGGPTDGRFLAEHGCRVRFEPAPTASEAMLAVRFTNVVLPAILRQRGLLVLHADAAVLPGGGAVVIGAEPGVGKSTALAALLEHGCAMLSDDVTVVRPGFGGSFDVVPGVARIHLAADTATGVGMDTTGLTPQPWRRMKVAVPTDARMSRGPAPLDRFYVLSVGTGDRVGVTSLAGTGRFRALAGSRYGPVFARQAIDAFLVLTQVGSRVAVSRITRPPARWSVDEVVAAILDAA